MPLLLHELIIGSGGSTTSTAGIQKCPPHHVAIATVSHGGSTTQVTQLQQNRIVAISSNHSRLNSDNGRLAEALAGNSPYSYPANSTMHIAPAIQVSYATPTYNAHTSSSSKTTATYSSVQSSQRYNKGIAKQSYQLPFVLQDHNYGAPPPPTPPHSPPSIPHVTVSSLSTGYKVQHVNPNNSPKKFLSHRLRGGNENLCSPSTGNQTRGRTATANIPISLNIHNNGSVTTPITNSVPTQYIASLPLHRQQFMPQPKAPVFTSPINIVSASKMDNSSLPNILGADTDEESRMSDRGSSIGTSGEETETAPEEEDMLQSDDSITRCICDMTHDDGYMIQCDRCYVWQHVDCMQIDRNNIPDEYLCEACSPRRIDKLKAKNLQMRRMQEIKINLTRVSSSDSEDNSPINSKTRPMSNKSIDRKVLKKKKPKVTKEVKILKKIMPPRKNSSPIVLNNETLTDSNLTDGDLNDVKTVKTRRRQSVTPNNESTDDIGSQVKNGDLQIWVQHFEVAVTNHYSPELRAKIQSIRINGISPEFLESANDASFENRCKASPSYNLNFKLYESKILLAAVNIKSGSAIVEYQGKYMLLSQWPSLTLPNWLHYMPYVVQYNMIKEGVEMCIDARTYGNNARFVRKAKKHNAQIRHIIKRGSVHLYLVACEDIKEGQEIVLSLNSAVNINLSYKGKKRLISGNVSLTDSPASTADEQINSSTDESPVFSSPRKNGSFQNKKAVKKCSNVITLPQPVRLTRQTTSASETFEELPINPLSPTKPRRSSINKSTSKAIVKSPIKITRSLSSDEVVEEKSALSPTPEQPQQESEENKGEHKPTREERKIAAIMKAFERMEKAHQRRIDHEKKRCGDRKYDKADPNSSIEEEDQYIGEEYSKTAEGLKMKKRSNSYSTSQKSLDIDSSPEMLKSNPESTPSAVNEPFRFPKTKKTLMTEWLNETVDGPVLSNNSISGLETSGVKLCYMRSPSIPVRRQSGPGSASSNPIEMAGRSAKKRWLRQAIIDESEPILSSLTFCSSPNSRPDSPNGIGDYMTPLKKRRFARESMSSEHSNTPPTTPLHTSIDDDKLNLNNEMEQCLKSQYVDEDEKEDLTRFGLTDVKLERNDDQLTVDISLLKNDIKLNTIIKKEIKVCRRFEMRSERKKKKVKKPKLKCKAVTKPRYERCKSKKKKKFIRSSMTKTFKTNKVIIKKENNSECKSKKGRKPAKKRIKNKDKLNKCYDNMVRNFVKLPPNEDDVLKFKKLKGESPIQDDSSHAISLDNEMTNISEDSNLSEKDDKTAIQEKKPQITKPLQTKRKLSILEYRKRKSVSTDKEPSHKEDTQALILEPLQVDILSPNFKYDSNAPNLKEYMAQNGNQSVDDVEKFTDETTKNASFQEMVSPFSDESHSPSSPSVSLNNFMKEDKEDVKWNDAPTLLEQQRENLTARLRREFGLCIPEDKSKGRPLPSDCENLLLSPNEVDAPLQNHQEPNRDGDTGLMSDDHATEVLTIKEKTQFENLSNPECDKL